VGHTVQGVDFFPTHASIVDYGQNAGSSASDLDNLGAGWRIWREIRKAREVRAFRSGLSSGAFAGLKVLLGATLEPGFLL